MKILCISKKNNPCCLGGVETFQRVLSKIFQDRIKFFAFKAKSKKYFKIKNVIEFDFKINFFMRVIEKIVGRNRYIYYKIKKEKSDILVYNSPNDFKKFYKICSNNILVQHSSWNYYFKGTYEKNKKLVECIRKNLDYYVFLSKYDQEKFVQGLNLDINKTIVIRHSCEIDLLQNRKDRTKKLIMLGRLDNYVKRFDLVINAMKNLKEFTLEIYGDGSDKEYLEQLIREKKLDNVFLCGGTNQVKEKLDENSIFIMTSDFEGYPITTIEAMRRGLPIIIRNTFEAAQDIVIDNGILLGKEWNEEKFIVAVNEIYKNYEYYSNNSIKMGKRHDFEVISFQWKNLCEKILKWERK